MPACLVGADGHLDGRATGTSLLTLRLGSLAITPQAFGWRWQQPATRKQAGFGDAMAPVKTRRVSSDPYEVTWCFVI